ncbi:MAG: M23 family metallopeptidase, partial [Clostridia bacterium]|nr:M23 family metallopeptidase [Clostridia bacterium]
MDDWNWPQQDWEEPPETDETEAQPKKRKTFWDLMLDQFLFFLILMIAFFGVKWFAGPGYDALRETLITRLDERTTLDTVLGSDETESAAEEAPPASEPTPANTAQASFQEYDEDSAEACVFDLEQIRLLSGHQQAVNGMCMPIQSTNVTSTFGYRVNPVTGVYAMHSGLDLGADFGEAIYAALDGRVIKATKASDYGNYIALDHGDGLVTLYAHCSQLLAGEGDRVSKGQTIALA